MKPDYKKVTKYILDSIDTDRIEEDGLPHETEAQKFSALAAIYRSEYGWARERSKNLQATFAEYLSGLPSVLNIAFNNCDILELAVKWGSLPKDYTEAQADRILLNWFNWMANQYAKVARKNGVALL